ncbi:MAG: Sporulation and spore germination [Parcubacteria group bacterium ADurb.Bin247]|jgi:hypothetical protein|nr:MAG: Sporulation and spore germination [Parcubacteria group bacterium ADurb.Bin247]HQB18652.1 GerMN domain-containing protein [Candidatus Pacearchaeota archaeon]
MTKSKILVILIGIIILVIIGYFLFNNPNSIEDPRIIAENWIKNNSPAYISDGFDLKYIDGDDYQLNFEFQSRSAGPRTIEVFIDSGKVVNSVIDKSYSEFYNDITTYSVPLFFIDSEENLVEIQRIIESEPTPSIAILELIKGLTEEEIDLGLFSSINPETKLNNIDILDGTAFVDFDENLDVSGSAMVLAVRNQIEQTLLNFPNINNVIISINGETEEILQP